MQHRATELVQLDAERVAAAVERVEQHLAVGVRGVVERQPTRAAALRHDLAGGARDPEDADSLDTALRETQEEMGILRDDVTILGEMDEVATRSRFRVNVFAGVIEPPYRFQPSADEIAEVVEFPVRALRDPSSRRLETRWQAGGTVTTYSYAYGNHLVFGATARILQQFLELLDDEELSDNGLESEGQRIE